MRLLFKIFLIIIIFLLTMGLFYLFYYQLNFLNTNSGAFNLLFGYIVALATVAYATLTWRLVTETEKLRKVQTTPDVITIIQPKEEWINFIDMVIKNIGSGSAHDIKFKISPDFEYNKGQYLSKMSFFEKGIKYLAPNQKFQFFLTAMYRIPKGKVNKPFNIEIKFKDKNNNSYTNKFKIDFSEIASLNQVGELPLHKIAKSLDRIERKIK